MLRVVKFLQWKNAIISLTGDVFSEPLLAGGLSAFICHEVSPHLSTREWNPAVFTERDIEGQGEGGGRTPEHWICRTGGDVKLEVRNNWCNAGEWRRGLAGGGGVEGSESQDSAVLCCRRTSIQSPLSCHLCRQTPMGPRIQRTGRTWAGPAALYTADCTMQQHYSLLLLTPCVHCSKYNYLAFSPLITLQCYASTIKSTVLWRGQKKFYQYDSF